MKQDTRRRSARRRRVEPRTSWPASFDARQKKNRGIGRRLHKSGREARELKVDRAMRNAAVGVLREIRLHLCLAAEVVRDLQHRRQASAVHLAGSGRDARLGERQHGDEPERYAAQERAVH